MRRTVVLGLCGLLWGGCGSKEIFVDLESVPLAKAACEAPTMAQLRNDALMLPGRNCQSCHLPSGQAASVRFTISGTVFRSLSSSCNTGGVGDVKVEILDASGRVQATLTSNAAGNFYTAAAVTFPIRARVSKDGVTREMMSTTAIGSCAACHQKEPKYSTEGILYLNK